MHTSRSFSMLPGWSRESGGWERPRGDLSLNSLGRLLASTKSTTGGGEGGGGAFEPLSSLGIEKTTAFTSFDSAKCLKRQF